MTVSSNSFPMSLVWALLSNESVRILLPNTWTAFLGHRALIRIKEARSSAISQKCTKCWARACRCWKESRFRRCGNSTREIVYSKSRLAGSMESLGRKAKNHSWYHTRRKIIFRRTNKAIPLLFRLTSRFLIKLVWKLSNTSPQFISRAFCWSREAARNRSPSTNSESFRISRRASISLFCPINPKSRLTSNSRT